MVEDDPTLRGLIVDVLRGSGRFAASGAGGVGEAEDLLGRPEEPVAAILLDTNLPDGDGLAWCLKLRLGGFSNPIVILTGRGGSEAERRSLDHGATAHIQKPVNMMDLLDRLSALLSRPA